MNQIAYYIFKLLRMSLYGTNEDFKDVGMYWKEIYIALAKNGLLTLTYKAMTNIEEENKPSLEMQARWKASSFQMGFSQIVKNKEILSVLDDSKKKGIELIVFKGLPLAKLYPNIQDRISSDADFFVREEDKERAFENIVSNGFIHNKIHSKECVTNFYKENGAAIELHTRLWEDYEGGIIEVLKKLDLTNPCTLIEEEVLNSTVKTLGYTEHLIFQIFHIAKHFALEGIGIRYIIDLALFVDSYYDNLDKEYFWKSMEKLGYTQFAICLFGLCSKFLKFRRDFLPEIYRNCEIDESIVDDFINMGKTGAEDKYSWSASRVLEPLFLGETSETDTTKSSLWNACFPSKQYLNSMFPITKGRDYLIPAAWVVRCFKIIGRAFTQKNVKSNIDYKIDKANKRIEMMKKTGLLK